MYHSNYYNLGTSGHRATSSFSYVPQYTPSYYNHHHSRSVYSSYPSVGPYTYMPAPPPPPPAQIQAPAPTFEDQPVNGGINLVLEYDLHSMSSFLSWCAFGMLKQNKNPTKEFDNLIVSVLFATRLPKSTIIIALEYMNQRFSSKSFPDLSESDIFTNLTVALILANKFNDDNTFTNRSWCGATGLKIELLNKEERIWLAECKWQLNVVNFESNIKTLEDCWKAWSEKYSRPENPPSSPIEHQYYPQVQPQYQPQMMPSVVAPAPAVPQMGLGSMYPRRQPSYNSIPSSPYQYSSPMGSSPTRYSHESIWSDQTHFSNIWSYTPTYHYVPNATCNEPYSAGFVGNANPYYGYNIAC